MHSRSHRDAFIADICRVRNTVPAPVPPTPSEICVLLTLLLHLYPEMSPATGPVPDKLADAWDAVKDGPKIANTTRALDTVGVSSTPPFFSIIR
jgi:hypothetical protein